MNVVPYGIETKGTMSIISLRPRYPTCYFSAFKISDECLIVQDWTRYVMGELMASRPSLVTPSVRFEMQCSGSFPLAKIPRIESPETPSFNEEVSIANGTVD